jgi:hypothetical protein
MTLFQLYTFYCVGRCKKKIPNNEKLRILDEAIVINFNKLLILPKGFIRTTKDICQDFHSPGRLVFLE